MPFQQEQTNLYYFNARYYDATIGRFINVDPVQDGQNWYVYVNNSPLSFTDPTGLFDDPYSAYMNQALNDAWNLVTYAAEKALDVIQGALDAAGFVPVLGEAPDLANAAISAARGNYGEAAASTVSIIPIIGDIVGKGGKYVAKYGDEAADLLKHSDEVLPGICFTADTLIKTEGGFNVIKNIKIGDKVFSKNVNTGETGLKIVTNVFVNTTNSLIHIHTNNQIIKTTKEHPFWVLGKGWVKAVDLLKTDGLLNYNNKIVSIRKIKFIEYQVDIEVYNFEVKDWHTYFVSDESIFVHNTCKKNSVDFDNAGMNNPDEVIFSKYDPETGTVTEFKGKNGAKVGYDGPHESPGLNHDTQHISWQSGGKRGSGGTKRGNIAYEGPQHPSRSKTKE